jgi:hypothetical protein
MATAGRSVTRKPRGASKPIAAPRKKVVPVVEAELELEQWEADNEPLPPDPEPEPARFPYEQKNGRDPVAVFNTHGDTSWNERLVLSANSGGMALQFHRGLLAVWSEEDAEYVRQASMNGRLYREAEDRFSASPIVCTECYPPTRWYSQDVYVTHNRQKHQG